MTIILFKMNYIIYEDYKSNEIKYHQMMNFFLCKSKSLFNKIPTNMSIIFLNEKMNKIDKTHYSKKFNKYNKNIKIYYDATKYFSSILTIRIKIILENKKIYLIKFIQRINEGGKFDKLLNEIYNKYIIKYNKFDNKYSDIIIKTNYF